MTLGIAIALVISSLVFLTGFSCSSNPAVPSPAVTPSNAVAVGARSEPFHVEEVTRRPDVVWGFDFLPDGRIILTERRGKMTILDPRARNDAGAVQDIKGVPSVFNQGQGGLLDVRVHPGFATTKWIYFTYAEPGAKSGAGAGSTATTVLARARLEGATLARVEKLFTAFEPVAGDIHFGSRIEFDGAGHVFVSVGDRNVRDRAQDLRYNNGKIMRLNENGSIPADNPFAGRGAGARPEIWSYGHRNPQGLAREPATGRLWEAEMGPLGGDEVNLIRAGANYGWPVITFGREYSGEPIGEGTAKEGMEQPISYWVPSISPSGIGFYSGDAFPGWKGNLFLANLSGQHLRRLVISDSRVISQEPLLGDLGARFRSVREGVDGFLYVSTDDGRLLRLVPGAKP